MKNCPNCGEILGDSVEICFKCRYNFNYNKVITNMEELKEKEKLKNEIKNEQLSKNPLFEYKVIVVNDLSDGQVNDIKIQETLNEWSDKGWKLHSIYSSEIGKVSTTVSILGFGAITNATIDQTVLIFERCIKS